MTEPKHGHVSWSPDYVSEKPRREIVGVASPTLEGPARPVPWAEIDDGITPLVAVLVDAGLEPFASCEGGEGHAFDLPTVRVRAGGSLRRAARIARKALHEAGYHGFTVSERRLYQKRRRPWTAYVEIELWGSP